VGARPVPMAVAGAVCIAFSGILVRLADLPPSTTAFYRCAYALLPLLALALWERRRYGPRARRSLALSWLAGGFLAADLVLWHHAIAAVGAGLGTVLANLQVVLVGLAAWAVLKERPEARVLVAVPVVLGGVVLISGVLGADAYGDDPLLGVVFGVATGIAYAGFLLVLRAGNEDVRRPAGPLFDATLAAALAILPVGWVLGELELEPTWPEHAWLITLALTSQVLGWLLISVALPRVRAVLTSVVLTFQPVMSVVLAMVLLDESPSSVQLAGIAVVLSGILLATVGRRRPESAAAAAPSLEPSGTR
jgi:drug/metabolite transporter (DMT)-like permease